MSEIARIIEAIARLEPKVIAIDLLLVDKGPVDGDVALAKSIAAHPTVLAAAAVFPDWSLMILRSSGITLRPRQELVTIF